MFLKYLLSGLIVGMLSLQTQAHAKDIDLVVLNMKGKGATTKQWKPLAKHIGEEIGQKVAFTMLKASNFVARAGGHSILLTNPVTAVVLEDKGEFEIVATLNHAKLGTSLAGVIIVPVDSPITDLKGLAGKKVGVVNKKLAAGGFLFQANELLDAGLVSPKDFKNFQEIFNQKAIVKRVITKGLDAGFIRAGMLSQLKGSEDVSKVRILNRMDEGLHFPRSTAIYPHWAALINKNVPAAVKAKIINSLMDIKPGSPVAKSGKMKGFVPASDYSGIKAIMKRMDVYKFTHK